MTGQCSGELVRQAKLAVARTSAPSNWWSAFRNVDRRLRVASRLRAGLKWRSSVSARLSSLRSVQISSVVLGIGLDGHCPPGSDHQPSRKRSPICASWWALSTPGHSLCLKPDSRVSQ